MNHILESPASLFSIRTCPYMHGLSEQLYHVLQRCRLEDLHWAFFLPFQSWCRTADWHCCLHPRHATLLQDHNKTRLWSQFRLAWTESHLLCYKLDMQTSHFLAYFGSVGLNHVVEEQNLDIWIATPSLPSEQRFPAVCLHAVPGSPSLPGFPHHRTASGTTMWLR